MNLHEYQAKSILKSFGVTVPVGYVAFTPDEAVKAAEQIQQETGTDTWAVKAQIHAGGRGKGTIVETGVHGVIIAKSLDEVREAAKNILGGTLVTVQTGPKGKKVNKVLVEQGIYYPNDKGEVDVKEFYVGILLNRATGRNVIMYSPQGGMEIEKVAEETPELIFREEIDPAVGLLPFQARRIAFNLGLSGQAFKNFTKFITALYKAYEGADASLVEINPVLKASDDKIFAADAKVKLDDDALFRHPAYKDFHDPAEEDPLELEAKKYGLNFVKLDGNVGCMVNGAGLAMATMDMIKLSGGNPANFLDVGGKATPETVEAGIEIILKEPNVKAILINIFGGIVRADRIANGVVAAYKKLGGINVPLVVRLKGTNSDIARKILDENKIPAKYADTLKEAAIMVQETLKELGIN